MKLIIAIVNSDDSSSVQGALTEGGYFVTKLSTTGGIFEKRNTTFFVGTNDDKVEDCISIIKAHSKKRGRKKNLLFLQQRWGEIPLHQLWLMF